MVNGREGQSPALRMHDLLLALAGRIDDSALGDARRLSVQARLDEAAELVAGTLVAGRIPVRSGEKAVLVGLIHGTGSDADYVQRVAVDDGAAAAGWVAHRFSADGSPEAGVRDAVAPVRALLPGIRAVHAVWRNTVAGSVPGPMPQRLVLVEVGADGSAPATAFRVEAALRRSGITAAVEVASPASGWTAYQEQALRAAVRIDTGTVAAPVAETESPVPDSGDTTVMRDEPAPAPAPAPEPEPEAEPQTVASVPQTPAAEPRTVVTAAVPSPAPAPAPEPEPEPEPEMAVEEPPEPRTTVSEPDLGPEPGFEPPTVVYPVGAAVATEVRTEAAPPEPDGYQAAQRHDLAPGELFWPQAEAPAPQTEPRLATDGRPSGESTADLSRAEVRRLRERLLAERAAAHDGQDAQDAQDSQWEQADADPGDRIDVPAPADPHLSDRDRLMLRELHEELAKRERDQAAHVRLNGWEFPSP